MSKKLRIYMAKGKKTQIKEIKLLKNDEILINGKEYVILETTPNIETAITMKISSNGNRILRFEDEKKKATIDVRRDIEIIKCTFTDLEKAKRFSKGNDKSLISNDDNKEIVSHATSYIKARKIVAEYSDKKSENYDRNIGITTFYLIEG